MTGVIFFHPYKSHESSAASTKAADSQRNVVQARNINLFTPNCSSNYCRNISYIIYTSVPFSCGVLFPWTRGQERREKPLKLPTFSVQCARRSEQHGPDQHQTSRRLHLLRPGVSSPYPKGGRFLLPPIRNGALRTFCCLGVWFRRTLALVVYFPISVTSSMEFRAFSAANPGARRGKARSREGLSGEWQVESARPHLQPPCARLVVYGSPVQLQKRWSAPFTKHWKCV